MSSGSSLLVRALYIGDGSGDLTQARHQVVKLGTLIR